jgi:hypothetical protein
VGLRDVPDDRSHVCDITVHNSLDPPAEGKVPSTGSDLR